MSSSMMAKEAFLALNRNEFVFLLCAYAFICLSNVLWNNFSRIINIYCFTRASELTSAGLMKKCPLSA